MSPSVFAAICGRNSCALTIGPATNCGKNALKNAIRTRCVPKLGSSSKLARNPPIALFGISAGYQILPREAPWIFYPRYGAELVRKGYLVRTRADGRVGVEISARDPGRQDPGLVERLTNAYNGRMGR